MANQEYPILVTAAPRNSRPRQYRTYLEVLQGRLEYLKKKEVEWKKAHTDAPANFFRREYDTIQWVLTMLTCFCPEERPPLGAPIPVLADECPVCKVSTQRPSDGRFRVYPWVCSACGYKYPPDQETPSEEG